MTGGHERATALDDATVFEPLCAWLEGDLDAIVAVIERAVLDELPVLADADRRCPGALGAAIRSHMPVIVTMVRTGAEAHRRRLPAPAARYARLLAGLDVPLAELLRSYEVGHAAMWRQFTTDLRDDPVGKDPEARADLLECASVRLFDYIQTATGHSVVEYASERSRRDRRAASRRREVVEAVLAGAADGPDAEAALGGYPLGREHLGYVVWAIDHADVDRVDRFVTSLPGHLGVRDHVSIPSGEHAAHGWVVVHGPTVTELVGELRPGPGIGFAVGEPERDVAGFRTSHRQALEARRIAVAGGLAGTVRYRDVAVVALATADAELADAFVRRELGALVGDDESNRRLLATLAVVLDEMGSPTRAARRLGVHPNTVVKRLERAEVAMGHRLDTSSLAMRVAVEIAVLAPSPSR